MKLNFSIATLLRSQAVCLSLVQTVFGTDTLRLPICNCKSELEITVVTQFLFVSLVYLQDTLGV